MCRLLCYWALYGVKGKITKIGNISYVTNFRVEFMSSNCLMSMLLVEWVCSSWCSLNALLFLGDLEQGKRYRGKYLKVMLNISSDGSVLQWATWLATTRATSLLPAGQSSPPSSAPGSSSSSWSPGRTWSTRTTTTPGGPTPLDTSWRDLPWFAFLRTLLGCGSTRRELGERSVTKRLKLYQFYQERFLFNLIDI